MVESAKTHFSLLNESERLSKCHQLASSSSKVVVWHKGSKDKFTFYAALVSKEDQTLRIKGATSLFRESQQILGSFELSGVNYFFHSSIIQVGAEEMKIDLKGEFFKLERRNHFRLLAYPIYKIFFKCPISTRYQGSNVIDLKTKSSQTGLFKNFLRLLDRKSDEQQLGSRIKLRVNDLSVNGMSVLIGKAELPFFKPDQLLKEIEILFSDEEIIPIPEAKIVYVMEAHGFENSKVKTYKVGLQFSKINESLDSQLSRKINKLLREVDLNQDFEDYLKK